MRKNQIDLGLTYMSSAIKKDRKRNHPCMRISHHATDRFHRVFRVQNDK